MVVIEYKNGAKYDGDVTDDKKHGHGTYCYKNGGKYEGEWDNDLRNGRGVNTWPNNDKYTGDWKDNRRHGNGTYAYAAGGMYEGQWENDQRHGKGKNQWKNGNCYTGEWRRNSQHGQGTFSYADGGKYEGQWYRGMRNGYGVNVWANGDRYEGNWKNNQKHGQGTLIHADGTREEKEWVAEENTGHIAVLGDRQKNNNNKVRLDLRWIDGKPALVMLMTKSPSASGEVVCPYLSLAREFVTSLNWSKQFFRQSQDRCYCQNCYKETFVNTIQAGDSVYVIPRGWARLGLTLDSVLVDVQEIWKKWVVTFHGTSLIAAQSILTHRNFCWPGDVLLDGTKLKIRPGHIPGKNHVYTSPTIAYSSSTAYSPVNKFHSNENDADYEVQVVLQCRQMPNSFHIGPETIAAGEKQICEHIPNSKIEYFTDRRSSIIAYGFLVRFRQKVT